MSAFANNTKFRGEGLLSLTKKASVEDESFGLLALCKEASVKDESFGLLALCKEASVSTERKAEALIKKAYKKDDREKVEKKSKKTEEKKGMKDFVSGHVATIVPLMSHAQGYMDGAKDGKKLKGILLGQHGLQGTRDKEAGNAGQHFGTIAGSGALVGSSYGVLRHGAGKLYQNINPGVPAKKSNIRENALRGAVSLGSIGATRYALGSYFADEPTGKKAA